MWRAEGAVDGLQGYFQQTDLRGISDDQNIERGAFWISDSEEEMRRGRKLLTQVLILIRDTNEPS